MRQAWQWAEEGPVPGPVGLALAAAGRRGPTQPAPAAAAHPSPLRRLHSCSMASSMEVWCANARNFTPPSSSVPM